MSGECGVGGIQLFWPATWIFWTWIDFKLCVGKEIVTWRWQHHFPSWKFINITAIVVYTSFLPEQNSEHYTKA